MSQTRGWRLVLAPRDAPSSVRRFAQRARRHRLRAALPWLIGLAVAALLGGVVAIVYLTPVLGVGGIEVTGVSVTDPAAVRQAAGVPHGTPLPRLDLRAIQRRVEALPPVHSAAVTTRYPHTVVVAVQERTAVAAVSRPGGYTLLDATGVAYLPLDAAPPGLPVLRIAQPAPGDATTEGALTVLGALSPALRAELVALVAESPTRIRLELTDNRLVIWGDATQNEAKVRAVELNPVAAGHTLDVSAPRMVLEK